MLHFLAQAWAAGHRPATSLPTPGTGEEGCAKPSGSWSRNCVLRRALMRIVLPFLVNGPGPQLDPDDDLIVAELPVRFPLACETCGARFEDHRRSGHHVRYAHGVLPPQRMLVHAGETV